MEIKINKEIRNYKEALFFGLDMRQFICSVLACGAAVGLYFSLHNSVGSEEIGWICILGAAPFAALGFFRYHGMSATQFLAAWVKSEILYPQKLVFRSENQFVKSMNEMKRRRPANVREFIKQAIQKISRK